MLVFRFYPLFDRELRDKTCACMLVLKDDYTDNLEEVCHSGARSGCVRRVED